MALSCCLYALAMGRESEAFRYTARNWRYLQLGDGKHVWYVYILSALSRGLNRINPYSSPGRFFLVLVTRMKERFVSGIVFSVTETNGMR